MYPGQPMVSLATAAYLREEKRRGNGRELPPAVIQNYDPEKGALISARIAPLLAKFNGDLSPEECSQRLVEARNIIADAKAMAPAIRHQIINSLFVGLSKAISSIEPGRVGAHCLYQMIDSFTRLGHESEEYRESGICPGIDISKEGLENPGLLAAVWLHRRLAGVSKSSGYLVNADHVLGLMAFECDPRLDGLCLALQNLDSHYPHAGLARAFGNPSMEPSLLLVKWDFVDRVLKLGGVDYLVAKGFDLNVVFESILQAPRKNTMHGSLKCMKFLLALVDHQHALGKIDDRYRGVAYGLVLQSALKTLNNKDASKHKGWEALIELLAPYAPAYLTVGQFVGLGRVMAIDENPLWGRPLSQILERGKFRKAIRKTVNPDLRLPVVKNLRLESFYTNVELYQMAGKLSILMEAVEALDVPPENEDPAFKEALAHARNLMSKKSDQSGRDYDLALAKFLPFMTRNIGEMPLILMAKAACFEFPDLKVRWPENMEIKLNKSDFKRALNALIEPEQRYQVVSKLKLECLYQRADILKMKGVRLSVDLGM